MDEAAIGIIGTIAGALVGGAIGFIGTYITNQQNLERDRINDLRQLRDRRAERVRTELKEWAVVISQMRSTLGLDRQHLNLATQRFQAVIEQERLGTWLVYEADAQSARSEFILLLRTWRSLMDAILSEDIERVQNAQRALAEQLDKAESAIRELVAQYDEPL